METPSICRLSSPVSETTVDGLVGVSFNGSGPRTSRSFWTLLRICPGRVETKDIQSPTVSFRLFTSFSPPPPRNLSPFLRFLFEKSDGHSLVLRLGAEKRVSDEDRNVNSDGVSTRHKGYDVSFSPRVPLCTSGLESNPFF